MFAGTMCVVATSYLLRCIRARAILSVHLRTVMTLAIGAVYTVLIIRAMKREMVGSDSWPNYELTA